MRELELFEYLKFKHLPDLARSEGTYDTFDCISEKKSLYIELKCRHTHYPDLLIEKSKYDRLVNEASERKLSPWYINSTPKGIWGFALANVPSPVWTERWMPTTTEFSNTKKRRKMVGFLHLDYALPL